MESPVVETPSDFSYIPCLTEGRSFKPGSSENHAHWLKCSAKRVQHEAERLECHGAGVDQKSDPPRALTTAGRLHSSFYVHEAHRPNPMMQPEPTNVLKHQRVADAILRSEIGEDFLRPRRNLHLKNGQ